MMKKKKTQPDTFEWSSEDLAAMADAASQSDPASELDPDCWNAQQLEETLGRLRAEDQRETRRDENWAKGLLADLPADDPTRRKAEAALAILSSHAYRRRDAIDSRLTFTLRDASHLLQVSERTMRRYIKSGKLRAVKIGREYRITLEDYDAFTAANANR